ERRRATLPVDEIVREARPRTGPVERVLIRDGTQVHVLPVDKIDYVEAQDDYVAFKSEGKQYLKDQALGAVEAALDASRFVRIHRSYILNIDRIARVELYAKDSRVAILRDGTKLPVSRAGYARVFRPARDRRLKAALRRSGVAQVFRPARDRRLKGCATTIGRSAGLSTCS